MEQEQKAEGGRQPQPEALVKVELTPGEVGVAAAAARQWLAGEEFGRRGVLASFAIWLLVGLVAAMAWQSFDGAGLGNGYGLLLLFILATAASAFLGLYRRRRVLARYEGSLSQEFSLCVEAEGLAISSPRGEFLYRWTTLRAIETAADGVLLRLAGYETLWIPARAFGEIGGREAFVARLENASGQASVPLGSLSAAGGPSPGAASGTIGDLLANLAAGWGFLIFRPSAVARLRVSAGQFVTLVVLSLLVTLVYDLLLVGQRGMFNWGALPALLYGVPWMLLAAWAAGYGKRGAAPLAGALALTAIWFLLGALLGAWALLAGLPDMPAWLRIDGAAYLLWFAIVGWGILASIVALVRVHGLPGDERLAAVLSVIYLLALPMILNQGDSHLWITDYRDGAYDQAAYERRRLPASEAVLYGQNELLNAALERIEPGQPGKPEVFLLALGGNGNQNVFKREVESVQQLFAERYGGEGHSLLLVNNPETVLRHPIASVTALRRGLQVMAERMNRDEDVLFLFLTSHGSADHRFDLNLWPYRFEELTPQVLRRLLDEAGIQYRVVVVSACYSGGFVSPLAGEDTLVISASRADRNSHGCSHEADWTFFGKAYFDEALRGGSGFEEAFGKAVQQVGRREKVESLAPSEPQMAVGEGIRRALRLLEQRGGESG